MIRQFFCSVTFSLAVFSGTARAVTPATDLPSFEHLSSLVQQLQDQLSNRKIHLRASEVNWEELANFHADLLRAMAIDPTRDEIKDLKYRYSARILTQSLRSRFKALKESRPIAERYGAENSFDDYMQLADEVLSTREKEHYSQARLQAKIGLYDGVYDDLVQDLKRKVSSAVELSISIDPRDRDSFLKSLSEVQKGVQTLVAKAQANVHLAESNQKTLEQNRKLSVIYAQNVTWIQRLLWLLLPIFAATCVLGALLVKKQYSVSPSAPIRANPRKPDPTPKKLKQSPPSRRPGPRTVVEPRVSDPLSDIFDSVL